MSRIICEKIAKDVLNVNSVTELVTCIKSGAALRCALHAPLLYRGADGCVESGMTVGRHPAVQAAADGEIACAEDAYVRELDRQLAMAASDVAEGFCFLEPRKFKWAKRFATSNITALNMFGQGFCYLRLVEPRARMRVARVLGPKPYVSDVLRVVRVVGRLEAPVEVSMTASGMFHVASVRRVDGAPGGLVNNFCNAVVFLLCAIAANPKARVGAEVGSVAGVSSRAERGSVSEEVERLMAVVNVEAVRTVVSSVLVLDVVKRKCGLCGCMVVVEGHEDRCAVVEKCVQLGSSANADAQLRRAMVSAGWTGEKESSWDGRRLDAWLGDAILKLDIQLLCLTFGIASNKLQEVLAKYTSNTALAGYYVAIDNSRYAQPSGSSVHNVATAFECAYIHGLRKQYLTHVFMDMSK